MEKLSKYFSLNLTAFIAGGLLIMFLTKSSNNSEIKQLLEKNKALLVENKKIEKSNDSIRSVINKSSFVIQSLNTKDSTLKEKVGLLNNKIQSLKYEEASNYANNFGSLDIQRYFADLK